jgi:predicted 3-demethylubiquinone-9 3-methyltransferase (glyoxalase superfamily)
VKLFRSVVSAIRIGRLFRIASESRWLFPDSIELAEFFDLVVDPGRARSTHGQRDDSHIEKHEESMPIANRITPCLWFDNQGEEAARFYVSIFPNSKIGAISRFGPEGQEHHQQPPGSVMTVSFELDGHPFTALNGGPIFKFNEAVSLQINCDTQAEIDHYWSKLSAGGDPKAQQCGWVKDRYGLSWQVVPTIVPKLMTDPDPAKRGRVMNAILKMKKIDIAALQAAADG